jgi:hypothetical protein
MKNTIIAALVLLCSLAAPAFASEGTGTAGFCERHGCQPGDGPAIECPDPVVCPTQTVTCEATDCSKTTVVVTPTPCPSVTTPTITFPDYVPCRKKNDGTLVCPRPRTPRRVLHPVK